MANSKGEIFKDKNDEFRARIRGGNGQTIATTEGYVNKNGAKRALEILGVNQKNTKDLTHVIKTQAIKKK